MINARVASLLAVLASCAEVPDDQPAPAPALTVDTFPDAFVTALCWSFLDCPPPAAVGWRFEGPPGYFPRCEAAIRPGYHHLLRRHVEAVRAGRSRFDVTEAERCRTRVLHACTGDPELLLERMCGRVFMGTVGLHGPCRLTAECAGDAYCRTTGAPCGTCEPRAPLGAPCMGGYDRCARPPEGWSECVGDGGSLRCVAARVATTGSLAPLGAPCGTRRAADGSIERLGCTLGGRCDAPDGAMGTCRGPVAVGAPCAEGEVCAGGGRCVVTGGRSLCVVPPLVMTAGGACGLSGASPRCDPLAGLRCEDGRCAPVRDVAGGPGCDWQNSQGTCPAGQVCRRATSRCEPALAEGAACAVDAECASGWCDPSGPTPRCVSGVCR